MRHSEAEIIQALETEKRMMARQQLLKELWKLSRLEQESESSEQAQVADSALRQATDTRAMIEENSAAVGDAALSGQAL